MKKLIALIASVAIMLGVSVSTLAADEITTVYREATDDYATTVNVSVGDQATLLVYHGSSLQLTATPNQATDGTKIYTDGTNIEFIDQIATKDGMQFVYKLREGAPAGSYKVKVGGSTGSVYESGFTVAGTSTGYTISGTVSDVVPYNLFGDPTEFDEDFYQAFKTTVTIQKDGYEGEVVSTIDVDASSKSYSVSSLEAGTYFVKIERTGFLTRYLKFVVSDETVTEGVYNVGNTVLIAGDINADWYATGEDVAVLFNRLWASAWNDDGEVEVDSDAESGTGYVYAADFNYDTSITGEDVAIMFQNLWSSYESYEGATEAFE